MLWERRWLSHVSEIENQSQQRESAAILIPVNPTPRSTSARTVSRVVSHRPEIQAAYIFGSVAHGRTHPDSDIDIAVLLGRRLPDSRALSYRLRLGSDLGVALGRSDVQLVILNQAPPLLAHRVLSQGTLVFEDRKSVV